MPANMQRSSEVDAFVQCHFRWSEPLRLHRAALGLEILRAPVIELLSPILVVVRMSGWLRGLMRVGHPAGESRTLMALVSLPIIGRGTHGMWSLSDGG